MYRHNSSCNVRWVNSLASSREGHQLPDENSSGEDRLPALRLHDRQMALGGVPRSGDAGELQQALVGTTVNI